MAIIHEQRPALLALESDLNSLVISCPQSQKRIRQQAGLQLYLRLSTSNEEMQELRSSVCDDVMSIHEISTDEADALLRKTHHEITICLYRKIMEKRKDLEEKHFRNNKRVKYRKQLYDLQFDAIFSPLQASEIMLLLKTAETNAAQYRSRYRREIRSILEDYFKRFERIVVGEMEDLQ